MKVLIIGSGGQLGNELIKTCPRDISLTTLDYPEVDLCNKNSIIKCIKEVKPDWVINAAAYTAVDLAEKEKEKALEINCRGVRHLAMAVKEEGGKLLQISTDFVFDGEKGSPYLPDDTTNPESVYGKTKLDGEKAVINILGEKVLIIRTAWLYSSTGNNFVKTMLRLMSEMESLNVVDDQIGTPCWAYGLANVIWMAIDKNISGCFHWTDAGVASWYDFAVAIQEEAISLGLLKNQIQINPISANNYLTPAKRPSCSVLDKKSIIEELKIEQIHWRVQLRKMLRESRNYIM
jgi:dTDP-4-dehydrorhamnose reductase